MRISFDALAQIEEVIGKSYNLIPKPDSPVDSLIDSPTLITFFLVVKYDFTTRT